MSEARRSGGAGGAGRKPQGPIGTVINGKWHVDARIGSGGMATVYAATHRNGHRAALKMLHTQLSRDASTRARFLREGYVANTVAHPGVVQVIDDGVTEDGAAFLVLELLEGETLEARRLRLGGALPIDEVLAVADQALDALRAAHEKQIVHRDVKPDNVFITNEGRAKLLDFGLARMKDTAAEATKTGVRIGTPEFMSPEQALGRRDAVDARSDVWGLGATLFTSITGKYVHEAETLHEQLVASATQRARAIRSLAPHVTPAVARVIDRALELEMQDRWPSAREMQQAFREARGSHPGMFVADSLTVPVSSPLSFGAGKPPSSDTQLVPPSSDQTIALQPPSSDGPTVSVRHLNLIDMPPPTTPPFSPMPTTARMSSSSATPATLPAFTPSGGVAIPAQIGPHTPQSAAPSVPSAQSMYSARSGHDPAATPVDLHSATFMMDGAPLHPHLQQKLLAHPQLGLQSPRSFPASSGVPPVAGHNPGSGPPPPASAMRAPLPSGGMYPSLPPQGPAPMPPRGSGAQASGRGLFVLVAIVLVLVCAAIVGFVLWKNGIVRDSGR